MNKPNTFESVQPCSGQYSFRKDLSLNAWLAVAVAVYLVTHFFLRRFPGWSPAWHATLSLSPLLPGLLYFRSLVRFVRGMDELQQRIQLEALAFAAVGTLALCTGINVLNAYGLGSDQFQHGLSVGGVMLVLFVLWYAGTLVASRRYK